MIVKMIQLVNVAEWGPMLAYTTSDGALRIECGCRNYTIAEAHENWAEMPNRKMTRVALGMAEAWYKAVSA